MACFGPTERSDRCVPGVKDFQVVVKSQGAGLLLLFVGLIEFLHSSGNLWVFVVGTSCCHDSAVEDSVKWVVGGAGFRLVSGKGKGDRAFVFGCFLRLPMGEAHDGGGECIE